MPVSHEEKENDDMALRPLLCSHDRVGLQAFRLAAHDIHKPGEGSSPAQARMTAASLVPSPKLPCLAAVKWSAQAVQSY